MATTQVGVGVLCLALILVGLTVAAMVVWGGKLDDADDDDEEW